MNRINKEFVHLSEEEHFKPITKWLDKPTKEPEPPEKPAEEVDYGIDEFDRLNPFDDDFKPDAETPPTSSPPSPPALQEEEEASVPPPKTWERPAVTSFLESSNESVDLQTVNQLTTKYGRESFTVSPVDDLKKGRDKIETRRNVKKLRKRVKRGFMNEGRMMRRKAADRAQSVTLQRRTFSTPVACCEQL